MMVVPLRQHEPVAFVLGGYGGKAKRVEDKVEHLLDALRGGEAPALRELVYALGEPLYRYVLAMVRDPGMAQDTVQLTFVRVYRARAKLHAQGTLRSYCYRIATNLALNALRDRDLRRQREAESMEARMGSGALTGAQTPGDERDTPERRAMAREIWEAVDRLPARLAQVLTLRFSHGLTVAETADVLALPVGTVATRQREALEELRGRLAGRPAFAALGAAGLGTAGATASGVASIENLLAPGVADPAATALPANLLQTMEASVMASIGAKSAKGVLVACLILLLAGGVGWFCWYQWGGSARDGGVTSASREEAASDNTTDWARNRGANGANTSIAPDNTGIAEMPASGASSTAKPAIPGEQPAKESATGEKTEAPAAPAEAPEVRHITIEYERVNLAGISVTLVGIVKNDAGAGVANVAVEVYENPDGANWWHARRANREAGLSKDGQADPNSEKSKAGEIPVSARFGSVWTDREGRFRISFTLDEYLLYERADSVDPVSYLRFFIVARHPELMLGTGEAWLKMEPGQTEYRQDDIQVTLASGTFSVVCKVQDSTGQPVQGATCWWIQKWGLNNYPDGTPITATTDLDGIATFKLPVLQAMQFRLYGSKHVMVEARDYATGLSEAITVNSPEPGKVYETAVTLRRGRTLKVSLRDPEGVPLAHTAIHQLETDYRLPNGFVESRWHLSSLLGTIESDGNGCFELPGLPCVRLRLSLTPEGGMRLGGEVSAIAGADDTEVTITIERPSAVTFAFVQAGSHRPLEVASCGFNQLDLANGASLSGGCTEAKGHLATFRGLRPGRYQMNASFKNAMARASAEFSVRSGESLIRTIEVALDNYRGSLSGIVMSDDSVPVANARVSVSLENPPKELSQGNPVSITASTGLDGTFSFSGLLSGKYRVSASHNDYPGAGAVVDVGGESGNPEPVKIILSRGGTLVVTAPQTPEGAKWEYQPVVITSDGEERSPHMATRDGRAFTFTALPPGRTIVMLESSAYKTLSYDGDPYTYTYECRNGQTEEYRLDKIPVLTLEAAATTTDGKPFAGGMLLMFRVSPDHKGGVPPSSHGWKRYLAASDDGRLTLPGLVPGRYVWRLWSGKAETHGEFAVGENDKGREITLAPESGH